MKCMMSCPKRTLFCASVAVSTLAEQKGRLKARAAEHKNAIQTRNPAYPITSRFKR